MKLFFPVSNTGLAILYMFAFLCPLQGECARIIYHRIMTPYWLVAQNSYIDSAYSYTKLQLTFSAGAVRNGALLRVPLIGRNTVTNSARLTVHITVANDRSIARKYDSDIRYGVSDGTTYIGFETCDPPNYVHYAPCHGIQGVRSAQNTLGAISFKSLTPRASDSFYPGQFVITLKPNERWGSCYTAHDGGFYTTVDYSRLLQPSKGLYLDIYKEHAGERVGIKFIKVTIIEE